MDELEARINARAVRVRRRMANLLDQHYSTDATPNSSWPTRNSHIRMWATHEYQPVTRVEQPTGLPKISPETFSLQIEGSLLIGHLDHASAAAYDRKTGFVAPTDDLDRSRGEKEDETSVPEVKLTHLFDKLRVEFQSVYEPRINPMARIPPPSAKKKKTGRRSSSSGATKNDPSGDLEDVDFTKCILSERHTVEWTSNMSEDAHAWAVRYQPPAPSSGAFQVQSVICRIQLVPRKEGRPQQYTIRHPTAIEHLFPHHGPSPPTQEQLQQEELQRQKQQQAGSGSGTPSEKKKQRQIDTTADGNLWPPIDHEIHLPTTLSMPEIIQTFFHYLSWNKLMDPEEKSTIVCNSILKEILGVERLPFSELQTALLSQEVIVPAAEPVQAVYVMKRDTAQNKSSISTASALTATTTPATSTASPALWQWDMECSIPILFPNRVRELMRRVKRRELEYTSSRTKARYLLAARRAKDEDLIRQYIDQTVASHSYAPDSQMVWHALARGAPPHTQARSAATADAQISYLLEQLPAHCRAARQARDVLEICCLVGQKPATSETEEATPAAATDDSSAMEE
jgi:hypothetical protein